MSRKILFMLCLVVCNLAWFTTAWAGPEANFWYFGQNAGLDFSSGSPVALTNGQLSTSEGCASISDSNGQLLFYTDGITIFNRNHTAMSNGTGLLGDPSSTHSGVIVPVIGQANLYYVFAVDSLNGTSGLTYSIVDMTLDNGLGAVTATKNQVINSAINSEKIAIAKHANGQDLWLLTMTGDGTHYAYLISAAGISTVPITSALPAVSSGADVGHMRVSSDNRFVVTAHYLSGQVDMMSFNNATGLFTARERFALNRAYGVEISPSGQYAYVGSFNDGSFNQYDLTAATPSTTSTQVASGISSLGALSNGPDGVMYIVNNTQNLHAVLNPNAPAASLDFRRDHVSLNGRRGVYGLPTFATFIVTPPQISIDTPPDGSSTSDTTPNVSGNAGVGNTVVVTIEDANGNTLQTVAPPVAGDGSWQFDATALPEGTYTVRATATNTQGDTVDATPSTFSIDTTAPLAVVINTPANNSTINDNTPTLSGTGEAGATVNINISDANGIVQTLSTTVDAQGNWTVDAAQLPDASYSAEAVAVDAAGNTSPPASVGFTVDTAAPSLTVDQLTDNALINDNTPGFNGTTEPGATVVVEVLDDNGQVIQTLNANVDAQGNWSVDAAQLPDGDYGFSVVATDAAGNATTPITRRFSVDTIAPAVSVATPTDGTITNDNTPTLSGAVEPGAVLLVTITDANGTVTPVVPVVDAQGNWTIDAAQLPDGAYTVTATATDLAGNTSSASSGFGVDTTPPPIALQTPVDGATLNDNTPTLSGTSEPGAIIDILITDANGQTVETLQTTTDAQGNWSVDAAQLPDGSYTASATSTDAAGNITSPVSNTFGIDTTPPTVALNTPADGTTTNDNTPSIAGTVEPGATLSVLVKDAQGQTVQTLMPTVDAQGNWTVDAAQLPDGAYTIEAQASDAVGNVATTAPVTVTVDTTPPAVTLTSPADGAQTNDDTPTITGTAEAGSNVTVTIKDDQGQTLQTLTPAVDAQGNWTVDAAQLPEGTYTVEAQAVDAAGNTGNVGPTTVTIDITPPALSITAPAANTIVATRNVDVSGTSDPAQEVVVEVLNSNGIVVDTQTVTTDANGDWTLQTQSLANGDYTARAKTSDAAGNDVEATQSFSVDSDEPFVSITEPATDTFTNNVRPAINGGADTDATVQVVVTDAQGNEIAKVQPTVDAQGNWSVSLDSDLADGEYTITATATRPNGKMATATSTVTVDTMGPDTTISTPADGAVTNANQPEITGTTEPGATVDVTVTNAAGTIVFTGQVTADDQGNWTVTPDSPLADDTYSIEASSTDAAGNTGAPSTATITLDTNAPVVLITSPSNGDTINDATPTISGTAEPGATVTILVDGMEVGQATAGADGTWSFDLPDALDEGEHTIEATSTDNGGNTGSSGQLTVTYTPAKAPVTITSPSNGGEVTGPSVTIEGTGEPGEEVTVTVNGEETTVTVGPDGMWSTTIDGVDDGETTITVTTDDGRMDSVTVTVGQTGNNATQYLLKGGCSSTDASPAGSLWLLGLVGLIALRRRRRRA